MYALVRSHAPPHALVRATGGVGGSSPPPGGPGRLRTARDDVFVTELSMDKSPRAPDVAAELSCGTVSETWRRKADTERELTFRLAGGLGILQPQEASTSRWTGERQIEPTNSILDLGIPWPGTIELRNEYLWEQHGRRGRFASVPTLYLKCHASERELSDAELLENAKALADDAMLLMSFVRRHWVTWYQYTFCTPQSAYQHRIESSRDVRGQKDRLSDSPVGLKAAEIPPRWVTTSSKASRQWERPAFAACALNSRGWSSLRRRTVR